MQPVVALFIFNSFLDVERCQKPTGDHDAALQAIYQINASRIPPAPKTVYRYISGGRISWNEMHVVARASAPSRLHRKTS
jgi:hypothetical protein